MHGAVLLALASSRAKEGGDSTRIAVARTSVVEEYTYENTLAPPEAAGRTFAEETAKLVFLHLESLHPETWRAFLRCNATPHDLVAVIRFSGPLLFLGERHLTEAHAGIDALISLSMPGVSADGTQALLYAEVDRGDGDVSGHYFLLHRHGNLWTVSRQVEIWIS